MQLTSIESVNRRYSDVYVSPHLDDVVLSCGGRILSQHHLGRSALVLSVFTAEPAQIEEFSRPVRDRVGDMAERREEDRRAMERLGADYLWLDHLEASFRNKKFQSSYGLFRELRGADLEISDRIAADIERICRRAQTESVYLPLGVGSHADHRVVFEAGSRLQPVKDRDFDLAYYEDTPYTFIPNLLEHRLAVAGVDADLYKDWRQRSIWSRAAETHAGSLKFPPVRAALSNRFMRAIAYLSMAWWLSADGRRRPVKRPIRLSADVCEVSSVIQKKLDAIVEYRSQIPMILGDLSVYEHLMREYSKRVNGGGIVERVWRERARPGEGPQIIHAPASSQM